MNPVLPPIHREVVVDADVETAFAVFTDGIGQWWPLASYGVYGADGSLTIVDGAIT